MSENTAASSTEPAPRVGIHEGSIGLPPGYQDNTTNIFVPADLQNQPNLSIARDWLAEGETLTTYVDRQLGLLKARMPGHKLLARAPERLGSHQPEMSGERIEAQYKNGAQTIRQRQAAFLIGPKRALILTAATARPFDERFETLWRTWLDSFAPPASADGDAAPADA
ncbi:DUF1795 domain-containing protein [Massilia pseudoviolaceinigra]|uniref:DUF1795 domain-containing protein n=1 Tax=Massilia pseudoviolaceinigra TaxID=3057165 RepID=UPI0027966E18|nr:DUF1795 domain-containing protein [Massilia sp. CCM 9206]MDQ1922301.1 DUF1795 domain-containing protein [Massilia sp. CCM 9206]